MKKNMPATLGPAHLTMRWVPVRQTDGTTRLEMRWIAPTVLARTA